MRYTGPLYRALNPVWARQPLSGRGAALHGGRFNPKGLPALYASLSIMTALNEANQAGRFQPVTLVAYDAVMDRVFDSRDVAALDAMEFPAADLADPGWRDRMRADGEAPTQAFGRTLIEAGFDALVVRSFAPGAREDDLNIVLWRWGEALPARLTVIDDEKRLDR